MKQVNVAVGVVKRGAQIFVTLRSADQQFGSACARRKLGAQIGKIARRNTGGLARCAEHFAQGLFLKMLLFLPRRLN